MPNPPNLRFVGLTAFAVYIQCVKCRFVSKLPPGFATSSVHGSMLFKILYLFANFFNLGLELDAYVGDFEVVGL